jgi:hypothetical protein
MKSVRIIAVACTVCVALLVVIGLTLSFAASSPVDAAKASAVAHGQHQEDLSLLGYQTGNGLFVRTAHVDLNAKGPSGPIVIRMDLVRAAFSPSWRISAYNDGISKRE